MQIDAEILKIVLFIAYYDHTIKDYQFVGSAVYLSSDDSKQGYIVTAAHVIDGLKKKGIEKVYLCVNGRDEYIKNLNEQLKKNKLDRTVHPKGVHETNIAHWKKDDENADIDVSYYNINLNSEVLDILAIKFESCLDEGKVKEYEIKLGDEVIITGLFSKHTGAYKNIPIVRVGNLAALNEEKVKTALGDIDAYLIECHSIGGLSGSPVYINLGNFRCTNDTLHFFPSPRHLLLGIIHGHYDEKQDEEQNGKKQINMGIAIVTPIQKIIQVIQKIESKTDMSKVTD